MRLVAVPSTSLWNFGIELADVMTMSDVCILNRHFVRLRPLTGNTSQLHVNFMAGLSRCQVVVVPAKTVLV